MRSEHSTLIGWTRGLVLACIVSAGFVSIVGSGGGVGAGFYDGICDYYPGSCGPLPPTVAITPARATVQVGGSLTFTAQTTRFADPTYQWQRSADGGRSFVDIVGATAASYTLAGANLGDDATVFRVVLRRHGSLGTPTAEASSRLAVSSAPGVVFQDGDFPTAGWSVSEVYIKTNDGATHTEERVASGGSPDAFRRMTHTMPGTRGSLGVRNLSASAVYDPALSGAIHVIDYAEDCALLSAGSSGFSVSSWLLIEQAGRRYRPNLDSQSCWSAAWTPLREAVSLAGVDFELIEGPACTAGQVCPDFSASAPPIRFGFVRYALASTTPTVHGIDNWEVTVWRR